MYWMGWVSLREQHYSKTRHWFNAFADNAMIFTIIEVKFMSQTLHYCTYWAWNQGIIGKWEWKKKILKTVTKANDGTSLFHNILNVFPFSYVFFRRFACNHQLIFDYSQMITSLADIKGKFYNLGGDENGETGQECDGINERSLRRDHHFPGCDICHISILFIFRLILAIFPM